MLTTYLFDVDKVELGDFDPLYKKWSATPEKTLWVDVTLEDPHEFTTLTQLFDLHVLAVEDVVRKRHPPKIEIFENCIFILYRGIASADPGLNFEHMQIGLFVGKNFLITVHRETSLGISAVADIVKHSEKIVQHKKYVTTENQILPPLQIALNILHASSARYLDNILEFESRLSEVEDQLQEKGDDTLLSELTLYKARLLKLRRTFDYHKGIIETLRNEIDETVIEDVGYFEHQINDLNDRFTRIYTLVQMHYDICGDLIEGYLSVASHRLNVTMRVLTVITAVFVPLSFIAGVYGMNFNHIPELQYRYGYFVLLAVMGLLASTLLFVFRRKKWI
ncbi:magnesium transporter CorA family protein [Teredinibacter purpureus]|uniref:magnesium transporter CorA family protein n=1 Tax=Teredinibacter purpureus TaxID=2731756 RepID=UPI0006990113|nr:magnesium transporter CorA family protein [Teredinibacter purpureus]